MPLLGDDEIADRPARLRLAARGRRDRRDLEFGDFAEAMRLVNAVADEAEAANHHPDILVHGWNRVRLSVTNHAQGGLTDADFALAGRIDALAPG